MADLSARPVLITGGTGGLGQAVVQRLVGEYVCIVPYRSADEWSNLQGKINQPDRLSGAQVDLEDEAAVTRFIADVRAQHGSLYGVVHLAGGFAAGSVEETMPADWNRMLARNLTSTFLILHATIPLLKARGAGRIITIGSAAVATRPAGIAAYNVSKAGIAVLTETVAHELKSAAITANTLLPGSMATPAMLKQMRPDQLVPLERVADTIAFLLSDAAAGITGAGIPITVTGGA